MTLRAFNHFSNMIIYCRPGFEPDAAAELRAHTEHDNDEDESVFSKITPMTGYVLAGRKDGLVTNELHKIHFDRLIFARQMLLVLTCVRNLPEKNKLEPIMAALKEHLPERGKFSQVFVETIDVDQGNEIGKFCKTFQPHAERALKKLALLSDAPHLPRLHWFFPDYQHMYIGISYPNGGSAWSMGIPRFRLPKDAASRSWLKIEEAMHVLLEPQERERLLKPGMKAVDLGAAPGGWTQYLTDKGLVVWAVDHANLARQVASSDQVHHERTNAFTFRPPTQVDWLVCDMVEKPRQVTDLISQWFRDKRCKYALFNLKLPMRKRHEEVEKCLSYLRQQLPKNSSAGGRRRFKIRAKQLYHDRKEISVVILPEHP